MRRFLKATALTITALVLMVAGALAALALFDWNHARGWIAQLVHERTGRELMIAGNLEVHPFSLHPRVRAEQVRFENAHWGESRPMLEAKSVEFTFDLLRLLFEGQLVVPEAALADAEALLQREEDGRRNWILKSPERTDEGPSPEILALVVDNGRLRVKDRVSDTDVNLLLQSRPAEQVYTIALSADGRVRGVPLKVKGASGGLLSIADEHTPYPVRLEGTLGDARATAEGTLTGIAGMETVDVKMTLAGGNLALLGDSLKISLPHTKPYKLSGKLERRGPLWTFRQFQGSVGKSDLGGDLSVSTAGGRPLLTAQLHSKSLDVADLGGFIGARPGEPDKAQAPGKILPDAPINLDKLRRIDAHVKLVATRFQNRDKLPLDHLDATLRLVDGVYRLEPVVFGVAGGSVNSVLAVDARSPRLSADVTTSFRKLRLNKLIPATDRLDESIGAIDGRLKLAGTGNSAATLLGTSNGRIDLYSAGGQISNLLMEYAGTDFAEILKFKIRGDQQIKLRCAVASFNVKDGLAASEALVVDTDDTVIGGTGQLSLREETIDLTLTPLPKDMSPLALRGPLHLTGSFTKPAISLDKKTTTRKVGAAVLLGLLNPLAAIIPLVETGPGKDANCANLIATVEAAAKGQKVARAGH
jgi:uncharacterized protein involved in outer membrane biogenesis